MMSSRVFVLLSAASLFLAACTGGGASATASTAPSASGVPSGAAATRIEVTLTDALKIEPATMTVPAGVPVTFVVTNTGTTEHEFYLGDDAAQAAHEVEMQAGGMMHDDPDGISLAAGETKELTHTFDQAGATLAGCHVVGHYAGGMKATITVTG
jgi:uncharacterized cupredoxin-like copper-binding protein